MLSRDQRVVVRNWTLEQFSAAVLRTVKRWGGQKKAINPTVVRRCYYAMMTVRATAAKFVP